MDIGLGIDVGGSKILGCAIDSRGRLLSEQQAKTPTSRAGLIESLRDVIVAVVADLSHTGLFVTGLGIGLPGLVNYEEMLFDAPNMPSAAGMDVMVDLRPKVPELFGNTITAATLRNVVVHNDATCAAAGEFVFGAADGKQNVVVLTLGTGIGGGVIADGHVVRGQRGFAGEFGHMVIDPKGPSCVCGGTGCWEQYASGSGLARLARDVIANGKGDRMMALANGNIDDVVGEHVFQAFRENDADAVALVDVFASYLAVGLSNLAEILDPSRIVVGGGLSRSADVFMAATQRHFEGFRRGTGERGVELVVAKLGERAGAYGAAAFALGVVA